MSSDTAGTSKHISDESYKKTLIGRCVVVESPTAARQAARVAPNVHPIPATCRCVFSLRCSTLVPFYAGETPTPASGELEPDAGVASVKARRWNPAGFFEEAEDVYAPGAAAASNSAPAGGSRHHTTASAAGSRVKHASSVGHGASPAPRAAAAKAATSPTAGGGSSSGGGGGGGGPINTDIAGGSKHIADEDYKKRLIGR